MFLAKASRPLKKRSLTVFLLRPCLPLKNLLSYLVWGEVRCFLRPEWHKYDSNSQDVEMLLKELKSYFASKAHSIPGMKTLCWFSISTVRIYEHNCSVKVFHQTLVNLKKAFCPSEVYILKFSLFDNLMNCFQWTNFSLSDHIKISQSHLWDKFIWSFVKDLFCYTANLCWSHEWSLAGYVYSFNKDVLSSRMCAKYCNFPSSFLPNNLKSLTISGILSFVTMYDLNVSRHMLCRAFISFFSVGGRKSITYQETAMFNSWAYLVPKYSRTCIFKALILLYPDNTWFCNLLLSSQKFFVALREEGVCWCVH